VLGWNLLTTALETGGSSILSYHIQWDYGGSTYVDLVGYSSTHTTNSYTVTTGIIGGSTYKFKIRALNFWGWGDYSSIVSIVAS
jgi:hypothetical protein